MRTRLPPVLAALGAALLLSSIEAEGKRLLSPPCPGENSRKTGEKKKTQNPNQTLLASVACSVSLALRISSRGFSLPEKHPLLLRFVHFLALRSRSFVFCLIHSVQCCVFLRLSLRCAVHTATDAAGFREDQPSRRGRRLHQLCQATPGVVPMSPGAQAHSLLRVAGEHLALGCDLRDSTK